MTAALTWTIGPDGAAGPTRVTLRGDITEASDFGSLLAQLSGDVTLDLEGIRLINSFGIREWMRFIRALQAQGRVELVRCAVPIVQQLYIVPNFGAGARVASVFAPYFCMSCNAEHHELVVLAPGVIPEVAGSIPCGTCGNAMEFDDVPQTYFAFAAS